MNLQFRCPECLDKAKQRKDCGLCHGAGMFYITNLSTTLGTHGAAGDIRVHLEAQASGLHVNGFQDEQISHNYDISSDLFASAVDRARKEAAVPDIEPEPEPEKLERKPANDWWTE